VKKLWSLLAVLLLLSSVAVGAEPPRGEDTQITDKPPFADGVIVLPAPENVSSLLVNGKLLGCFFTEGAAARTVWLDYSPGEGTVSYETEENGKLVLLENRYEQGQQGVELQFYPEEDGTVTAFVCLVGGKTLPSDTVLAVTGYSNAGRMSRLQYCTVDEAVLNHGLTVQDAAAVKAFLLDQSFCSVLEKTK